jgi:diphthamide biosynthesis protein 3
MVSVYEEVEIEDMIFDKETEMYHYPCPCGDKFGISLEGKKKVYNLHPLVPLIYLFLRDLFLYLELLDGEDIASCPSCTLQIRVIYDQDGLPQPA